MSRSRKLAVAGALTGAMLAAMATVGLSTAAADTCTITATIVGGDTDTFIVDAPPNTPMSSLSLPVSGVIASETDSCLPGVTATTPGTVSATTDSTSSSTSTTSTSSTSTTSSSTTSSSTTSSSTSTATPTTSTPTSTSTSTSSSTPTSTSTSSTTTGTSTAPPHASGPAKAQTPSVRPPSATSPRTHKHTSHKPKPKPSPKPKPKPKPKSAKASNQKGVPTASNPTFSLSLPGPAPIGVPNFFIDSFRIPPFLLPIYQAAGIQYDVPWQVLAAINEIETDYGRDLSVSSAGAVGWMQFLPSTWKVWGVDANGDGVADPYNPVDAIFTAARYLHAAGASTNLSQAIFAYNHANWYVQSVLLRAKLIGGIPSQLISALTGLVEGHFPVAAPAKYDDDSVLGLAKQKVKGLNAAIPVQSDPNSKGTSIFAKQGSPVIAVNDGKIVKIGESPTLGRYLELQDSTGNIYTYAQLGSITTMYPVPKPIKITPADIARELSAPAVHAPSSPATAGAQQAAVPSAGAAPAKTLSATPATPLPATSDTTAPAQTVATPMVKERLFADPARPASYAAGGALQLKSTTEQISNFQNYFSDVLHLARNQYTLRPLKVGSIVVAGTILGRIGAPTASRASQLYFMIQPAGKHAPQIDPKPILDGWKLLEATAVYRADGVDPFFGPGAKNPTVGQVLLMSKLQLTNRILQDPHVQIYRCGRRDIAAGLIDRRVLATIEFLSASGLDPYVSGLDCGHSLTGSTGTDAAGATGASVDISKINNIPILGHQGPGSITDITIRRLLTLQGAMTPDQIISTMSYSGQSNTIALPDHNNRIQITFTPQFGTNPKLSSEIKSILQPGQWIQLINRISQIPEPVVPIAPSKYAIRTRGG